MLKMEVHFPITMSFGIEVSQLSDEAPIAVLQSQTVEKCETWIAVIELDMFVRRSLHQVHEKSLLCLWVN